MLARALHRRARSDRLACRRAPAEHHGHAPALWRVTIQRYDENASMTMVEADPDVALAELVRYAQADAA